MPRRCCGCGRSGQRPRPAPPEPPLVPTGPPRRWSWDPPPCPGAAGRPPARPRREADDDAPGLPDETGLPCRFDLAGRPGLPDPAGFPDLSQLPEPARFFDPVGAWSDGPRVPSPVARRPEPLALPPAEACPAPLPLPLPLLFPFPLALKDGRAFHGLGEGAGRPGRPVLGRLAPSGAPRPMALGCTTRRLGGSPITAAMAVRSGTVVPWGTPRSRWSRLTAAALSGVTKLTTTPVAPARAVRPDRCT